MKNKNHVIIVLLTLMSLLLISCGKPTVDTIAYEQLVSASIEETVQTLQEEFATQEETKQEETQTQEQQNTASIVMVGDVLLHTRVSDSGIMEDGTCNYQHLFANVKDEIAGADLALVNQEVILGGTQLGLSGYPTFNGAFEVGDSLVDAGFDVILHATNHALDKGKKGLLRCIHFWKEAYPQIGVVGIYESQEEADQIYVKTVNDMDIAIINVTYGTNGIALPNDMPYAVTIWNQEKIASDVAKAKELADFVIVCPHWGTEYVLQETNQQRKQAQFLADLGVDLILGTHPHVVEPVTWLTGAQGNQTLCYYSLGNFINATSGTGAGTAKRMLGAMAQVTIGEDELGNVEILEYGVEPLVSHLVEGRGAMTTYRLADYTQELANANEIRKQDATFSLEYCKDICRQVFADLYQE